MRICLAFNYKLKIFNDAVLTNYSKLITILLWECIKFFLGSKKVYFSYKVEKTIGNDYLNRFN